MKKIVGLIIVVLVIVFGKSSVALVNKLRHASRLEFGILKFKLLNLSSKIQSSIVLSIGNFSATTFIVDQINANIYTSKGQLLAEQIAPLSSPLLIYPNKNNKLPLNYKLNLPVLINEIKNIGGISSVLANYLTTGKYGLPIQIKGFVVSGIIVKQIQTSITV